jgi:hypothetical protein
MDESGEKRDGAWLPVAIVALGLALTVLLVVMRGPAWLGLLTIGLGGVMQYAARPKRD